MKVIKRNFSEGVRKHRKILALVPTMGNLHKAHISLIKKAKSENDIVIVSIFVNPAQFGLGEDFKSYPRTFKSDFKILKKLGVDVIFKPEVNEIYKKGFQTSINVRELNETMCGPFRPGHFEGVATVVAKLFNIVRPDSAYFGQKDYQQFKVIERMVSDLNFNVKLVLCPIVREKNGLAVSSRNSYLTPSQRVQASYIYKSLKKSERLILRGEKNIVKIEDEMNKIISKNIKDAKVDYIGIFDGDNLKRLRKIKKAKQEILLAAAVRVGKARLIDNILINN